MKTNFTPLFILIVLLTSQPTLAQQPADQPSTWANATFNGSFNFKQIPTNIGSPFLIMQACDTSLSPELHSKQYTFLHARMGKIKDVKMIYTMENDTLRSITILPDTESTREQIIRQAHKQFGPSDFSQNNLMNTYTWSTEHKGQPISISLVYTDHEPTSEMRIEESR